CYAMEVRRLGRGADVDRRIFALYRIAGIRTGSSSRKARSRRNGQSGSELHHRVSIDPPDSQAHPERERADSRGRWRSGNGRAATRLAFGIENVWHRIEAQA